MIVFVSDHEFPKTTFDVNYTVFWIFAMPKYPKLNFSLTYLYHRTLATSASTWELNEETCEVIVGILHR